MAVLVTISSMAGGAVPHFGREATRTPETCASTATSSSMHSQAYNSKTPCGKWTYSPDVSQFCSYRGALAFEAVRTTPKPPRRPVLSSDGAARVATGAQRLNGAAISLWVEVHQ